MGINCNHPTCQGPCRRPVKEKKIYRIPRESKTRKGVNKLYDAAAKAYRIKNTLCRIKAPDCTMYTEGVHHLKGKATTELLMEQRFWLPACNWCNGYVEEHSAWAMANGFKLSKFN
jgi:hypothetical protein